MTSLASSSISLIAATDIAKVISKNSTATDTFSNVQSLAAAEIDGGTGVLAVSYKNSLVTSTATASLTLKGGAAPTDVQIGAATGGGEFGTIAITSTGTSANSVANLSETGGSTFDVANTVTVAGSADLTLGSAAAAIDAQTLNAAGFTGALTAYIASATTTSLTGGSGNDTIYLADAETFFAADDTTARTIDGGSGANTLVVTQSLEAAQLVNDADSPDTVPNHSIANIQTVKLVLSAGAAADAGKTIDASVASSVTAVELTLTNADVTADGTDTTVTGTVTNIKSQAISATGTASATDLDSKVALALTKYDGSGAADTASVTLAGAFKTVTVNDASDDAATTTVSEAGGIENVAITTGASNVTVESLVAQKAFGVTLSGSKNVTLSAADLGTTDTTNASTADDRVTINASGLTGTLDLTKSEAGVYTITTGSGTSTVRLGAYAASTTVVGGGTETVNITETAATVAPTFTNVDVVNYTAAETTVGTLNAAGFTNVGKLVLAHKASPTNSNENNLTVTNLASAQAIEIASASTDGFYDDTVTLNAATAGGSLTGVTLTGAAAMGAAGHLATIATNAAALTISNAAISGSTVQDQSIKLSGAALTSLTLNGNGKFTVADGSAAPAIQSLTANNQGSLDVSGISFDTAAAAATVTTNSTTAAATTTASVAQLTNGAVHFQDNGGTDTLAFSTTGATMGYVNADGYETIAVTAAQSTAAHTMNFRDSSGYSTITYVEGAAGYMDHDVTLSSVASGTTVKIGGLFGNGADTFTIAAAAGTNDTLTLTSVTTALTTDALATVATSGFETVNFVAGGTASGSTLAATVTGILSTDATTLNIGNTTGFGALAAGKVTANSATAVNLNATNGAVTYGTAGGTSSATAAAGLAITSKTGNTTTVNEFGGDDSLLSVTGSGDGTVIVKALGATTALATVDFGSNTGNVTLGTSSAALSVASTATITTGTGNDSVTLNAQAFVTTDAGTKTSDSDTLVVVGTQNSGTGIIDLSSSTDQVVNFNGVAETKAEKNFENVDLSAVTSTGSYGFNVTAKATGSTITGSGYADVINGGAGADVLNGGAGNDTIVTNGGGDTVTGGAGADTISLGAGADVVVFADGDSTASTLDAISSFAVSADKLDLTATTITSLASGSALDITGLTNEVETGTATAYSVNGIVTLAGTEITGVNTLAEWLSVANALAVNVSVAIGTTAYQTLGFEFNGDTYVVQYKTVDVANTETTTEQTVVKLVGVTGITALGTTAADNTVVLM